MTNNVFLLWIDHSDSYELVGVYSEKELAEQDKSKIEPTTFIQEKKLNKGTSLFLASEQVSPEGEEET